MAESIVAVEELNEIWCRLRRLYKKQTDKTEKRFLRGLINEIDYHTRKKGVALTEGLGALGVGTAPLDGGGNNGG